MLQGGPLPVISGVITPISRVITLVTQLFSAIYRGPITLLITGSGANLVVNFYFLSKPFGKSKTLHEAYQVPRDHGKFWKGSHFSPQKRSPAELPGNVCNTPRKTNECPLKINGWKIYFLVLGGGFKHVLFSSRKLGKIPILTSIFFNWVGKNQNLD